LKIGKNLCQQRIGVYNNIEEIDFEKLIKMGNIILKVSNGCHDNVYISEKNTKQDILEIKKKITYHFNRDYSLLVPEFFHSYSKKRIVVEKKFTPINDLYEFRFLIINREIKMIGLTYFRNNKILLSYYDDEFNPIDIPGKINLNLSMFKKNILYDMKSLAIKLSDDFPNFIRVDLYLFHNKIYLSELTFDCYNGMPRHRDKIFFVNGVKKWKRIE